MRRFTILIAMLVSFLAAVKHGETTSAAAGKMELGAIETLACQYVISPASQAFQASGGTGNLSLLTQNNCQWTAVSNASWLTITLGSSGSGAGRINFTVSANPDPGPRSANIQIGQQSVLITQAGKSGACLLTPINIGQTVSNALSASDCRSPLRIKDGIRPLAKRYTFNGTAGKPVIISLTSVDFDTYLYLLGPDGAVVAQNDDGGTGTGARIPFKTGYFTPSATGTFTIEATSFGSAGSGSFNLTLTSPPGNCSYSISPASHAAFSISSGTGTIGVTAPSGCGWTAISSDAWVNVTSGASGSGPGTVNYSVSANGGAARLGSITVAGLTYSLSQAGGTACPTITTINPLAGAVGSSITIAGTNLSGVTSVKFANGVTAPFTVNSDSQLTATVPNGAVTGAITASKAGCLDAQSATSFAVKTISTLVSVSAANYVGQTLAAESIVAGFGPNLATGSGPAQGLPLPTSLFGTTVSVRDATGTTRAAPLFYVSPGQVNYLIPAGTATGPATVTITSSDGSQSVGGVQIASVSPGVFTASQDGSGPPAAYAIRVKTTGAQIYEPVFKFDAVTGRPATLPIDLGPPGEIIVLELYGTGIRGRSAQSAVTVTIGGVAADVQYASLQPGYIGLDQINAGVPRTLIGRGEVDLAIIVDGKPANVVKINFK